MGYLVRISRSAQKQCSQAQITEKLRKRGMAAFASPYSGGGEWFPDGYGADAKIWPKGAEKRSKNPV